MIDSNYSTHCFAFAYGINFVAQPHELAALKIFDKMNNTVRDDSFISHNLLEPSTIHAWRLFRYFRFDLGFSSSLWYFGKDLKDYKGWTERQQAFENRAG